MTRRVFLSDPARLPVALADVPKRRVDPDRVAEALGAAEILPAPPDSGSPIRRYAVRRVALAPRPPSPRPDRY
jgi:hypothetical protein